MKKRLLSIMITIIMLFALLPTSYAYPGDDAFLSIGALVEEKKEADVICKLLIGLEFLNYDTTNFIQNELADYSDYVTAIAAIENIDASLSVEEKYKELKERSIVFEDEMPTTLLLKDVIYSGVRLTGMWRLAEKVGGFPQGYQKIALEKKLLRNLKAEDDQPLTKGEFVQLIYNILTIPSYVETGVENGNMIYAIASPATLLERRFDVTMVEGVVTANGLASLYGRSELEDYETEINRTVYNNQGVNMRIYLGKRVVAFIQQDNDDEKGTVLCTEISKKNDIKSIGSQYKDRVTQNSISFEDGDKIKNVNIPNDAIVLYNGVSKGGVESVNMKEITDKCSSIEAIDNDNDGNVDVVSIWEYEHFAVSAISSNVVFLKYGMKFNGVGQIKIIPDEDDDFRVEAYKNGISISKTTEISPNDIISVAMSDNYYGDKLMIVQVSDNSYTGQISSINKEGDGYVLGSTAGEFGQTNYYPVTNDFARISGLDGSTVTDPDVVKPTLGTTVIFALTYEGHVADIRKNIQVSNYGYIIKVGKTEDLKPVGEIKFIDASSNVHICSFAKNVKYYDEEYIDGKKLKGFECADRIVERDSEDYRTLIMYNLNNENEITDIYFPYDNCGNVPGNVGYPLTLDFEAKESGEPSTYYFGFFDSYRYFADLDNYLFIVPSMRDADDEELYTVVSQSFYGTHYRFQNIQLYCSDRFYKTKVGVTMAKATNVPAANEVPAVVSGISYVNDKKTGDTLMNLKVYQGAVLATFQLYKEDLVSVGGFIEGVCITDLKKGDIIQFGKTMDGKIDKFTLMFRPTVESPFGTECRNTNLIYGTFAKVMDVKGDFILANTSADGTLESGTQMYRLGNPNAVRKLGGAIVYKSSGIVESAAATNLMIGDNVYLVHSYGFVRDMFIIRE